MTDAQKFKFYFPAWTACVKANGWRKTKGRLVLSLESKVPSPELAKMLVFAQQRATMARRGMEVDDLRHACHLLALGKDKSSNDLTNPELDRVVTLFQVLTDPDNLTARLKWDAYERGEDPGAVTRVEYFIRRCPDSYVRAISAARFGTRDWENLTVKQKGLLSMTLANRRPKAVAPVYDRQPKAGADTAPLQPEPVPAGNLEDEGDLF